MNRAAIAIKLIATQNKRIAFQPMDSTIIPVMRDDIPAAMYELKFKKPATDDDFLYLAKVKGMTPNKIVLTPYIIAEDRPNNITAKMGL